MKRNTWGIQISRSTSKIARPTGKARNYQRTCGCTYLYTASAPSPRLGISRRNYDNKQLVGMPWKHSLSEIFYSKVVKHKW